MDIFVLNKEFKTLGLVEAYTSFIWTERWAQYGDFELKIPLASSQSRQIHIGNYIYIDESRTLMIIERYERVSGEGDLIKISGRSIVSSLLGKISPGYTTERRVSSIPTGLVSRVCVLGLGVSVADVIPNLSIVQTETFGPTINYESGFVVLYDEIKRLADEYDFGFRMDYKPEGSNFTFRVVRGENRRASLSFSPDLGNIYDLEQLRTTEEFKNVAYVTHRDRADTMIVYKANQQTELTGLDRRAIHVQASGSSSTNNRLIRAGREALDSNQYLSIISGELVTDTLRYGIDYYLGDLVNVSNEFGRSEAARVTEYTWSVDNQGHREFPTFTSKE